LDKLQQIKPGAFFKGHSVHPLLSCLHLRRLFYFLHQLTLLMMTAVI